MDDNSKKRKRNPNYTTKEKEVLLNIVQDFKNIVENKKTDAVSVNEKKEAWNKIANNFNSVCPNLVYRPVESLKKYYEHLKEDLRKRAGESKKNIYKTGGGPSCSFERTEDDLLLSLINNKTVYGLDSTFDSDHVQLDLEHSSNNNEEKENVNNNNEILQEDLEDTSNMGNLNKNNKEKSNIEIVFIEKETNLHTNMSDTLGKDWRTYKGNDLKTPASKVLKKNIEKVHSTNGEKKKFSRRRPPAMALTSSVLAEKYEILVDKKIELVECYKKEHLLRMESLELDIALKKSSLMIN